MMAKYRIKIKKSALKEIKSLPVKALKAVLKRIDSLINNPRPLDCKKLCAQEKYRIRVGDYRILYSIENDVLTVYIVKVGHRKNVYKLK